MAYVRRNLITIFIIVILLLIPITYGVLIKKPVPETKSPSEDHVRVVYGASNYTIEISVNRSGDYLLYVPVPLVGKDDIMSKFGNFSFICGSADFGMTNVSRGGNFGNVLWIHSNGSLKMVAQGNGIVWIDRTTWMEPRGGSDFWTCSYCERSVPNQQIVLNITSFSHTWVEAANHEKFHSIAGGGAVWLEINGVLTDRWVELAGNKTEIVS